ncbi:MAG: hypothetical protein H7326_09525 [Bdellovibrionaceae bacterium]|nr:hypothetical protein [Pseudobdellovibrionaceae bacterium]
MKTVLYIVAGFLTSALVVACGSKDDGNVAAPGAGAISAQCPVGATYQNGYCIGANGQQLNTGSVGFYAENYRQRNMTITGAYTEFLRDAMGVCDREKYSGGGASCATWINGGAFDVVIQSPTSTAQTTILQATFRAARRNTGANSDYSYSLPSGGALAGALLGFPVPSSPAAYLPKLQLNMTVSVTNNYQGFEARGYGDFNSKANRSLIQIQIPQGKLEDSSLPYRIAYRNQIIANGQFIRCNTADCGLSQPVGY